MNRFFYGLAVTFLITLFFVAPAINAEDSPAKEQEVKQEKGPSAGAEEAGRIEEGKKEGEEAKKIVVARVNGSEINMFSLVRAMNRVAPRYVKEGEEVAPETTAKIRKEALDRLIFEELAVQEAIKQGINPSAEDIDKVVSQVKENLGSEEAYKEYLEKNGLTGDALKKLIERSRRFELIAAKEVYGKVQVDEKLLREEYEKEKSRYVLPDDFMVEDVLFLKNDDEEAAEKKAGEVLGKIKENDGDVWQLVLDGTFIVRKIKITKERNPGVYKAMADMKAGELSGVIKDKDGLHIIKVTRKEPSRQATFEEARPTLEPRFLVPAQEKRKEDWEKELREKAEIDILPEDTAGKGENKGE